MTRPFGFVMLCGTFTLLVGGCASRAYVAEQVGMTEHRLTAQVGSTESRLSERASSTESRLSVTETRLTERVESTQATLTERADAQEAQLREAAERAMTNRQAIEALGGLASGAKTQADTAAAAARDAESRLSRRIADRNKYRLLETRFVYFDSGRADIRQEAIKELEDVASALKEDPNAILEMHGFADPRGSDRYNSELARDRVDAVIRYLVQHHGIELRQLRAVAMGKTALTAGSQPGRDIFALARRVDMRLLTPWSSWEDKQSQIDQSSEAGAASPRTTIDPVRPPRPSTAPRDLLEDAPWRTILQTISPQDLGATD
jgi:outer membrane protein OmpA-like peptidoglycan-associated protein